MVRAVAQRVRRAWVVVDDDVVGSIEHGLLVYLAAGKQDTDDDVSKIVEKIATLRVFEDAVGKMSLAVADVAGAVLVVPQFTLYGDVRSGRRPSFEAAAVPERAEQLYEGVCSTLRARALPVETGRFRATMAVHCEVDGPVTILIDTQKTF